MTSTVHGGVGAQHHPADTGDAAAGRGVGVTARRTVFFVVDLVVAIFRVVVMSTGVAIGFALLALGVGRPILRAVRRMGVAIERLDHRLACDALGVDVSLPPDQSRAPDGIVGALVGLGRSWRRLLRSVVAFTVTITVWAVPLSLLAMPVLLAVGIEPTARIASRDWELAITTWGPAIICAVVGLLLVVPVPAALRHLAVATVGSPSSVERSSS